MSDTKVIPHTPMDLFSAQFERIAHGGQIFYLNFLSEDAYEEMEPYIDNLLNRRRTICNLEKQHKEIIDGIIFMNGLAGQPKIYNRDGSDAGFCGNATFGLANYIAGFDKRGPAPNLAYYDNEHQVLRIPKDLTNVSGNMVHILGNNHFINYHNEHKYPIHMDANYHVVTPVEGWVYQVQSIERGIGPTASCVSGMLAAAHYIHTKNICDLNKETHIVCSANNGEWVYHYTCNDDYLIFRKATSADYKKREEEIVPQHTDKPKDDGVGEIKSADEKGNAMKQLKY